MSNNEAHQAKDAYYNYVNEAIVQPYPPSTTTPGISIVGCLVFPYLD